jgi:hypothetical protein
MTQNQNQTKRQPTTVTCFFQEPEKDSESRECCFLEEEYNPNYRILSSYGLKMGRWLPAEQQQDCHMMESQTTQQQSLINTITTLFQCPQLTITFQ